MLTIFLVFAEITHYTFFESLKQGSSEILQLTSEKITFKTHQRFETSFKPLLPSLRSISNNTNQHHNTKLVDANSILSDFIEETTLYTDAFIVSIHQKQIHSHSSTEQSQQLLDIFLKHLAQDKNRLINPSIFNIKSEAYLFWPLIINEEKLLDYIIITRLNTEAFMSQTLSYLNIPNSGLFISSKHTILSATFDFSQSSRLNKQDIETIVRNDIEDFTLTPVKNFYFFTSNHNFFGLRLNFLIPKRHLTKNLVSLKNRIIAALIIVGWITIWITLILAYKISNPIQRLSQITKDIILFNYSTELKFKPGNDEIGELSKNFETMRVKIKNLIAKDPLTNTYNRRFLMHVFELAVLKAIRLEEMLSFIILDIDNFKKVNDTHGHQCGDEVLKELGKILIDATRNYDTAARYGGEEFVVLLPDTTIPVAHRIAERIRMNMEALAITWEDKTMHCTLSLGVARFDGDYANTTADIIGLADKALYEAKRSGKNKTVIHQHSPDMPETY